MLKNCPPPWVLKPKHSFQPMNHTPISWTTLCTASENSGFFSGSHPKESDKVRYLLWSNLTWGLWKSLEAGGNGVFESSKTNPPLFDPLSLSGTSEFFLDAHGRTCGGPTSRRKCPPRHAGRPAGWVLVEIGPKNASVGPVIFACPPPPPPQWWTLAPPSLRIFPSPCRSWILLMLFWELWRGVGKCYRTV